MDHEIFNTIAKLIGDINKDHKNEIELLDNLNDKIKSY